MQHAPGSSKTYIGNTLFSTVPGNSITLSSTCADSVGRPIADSSFDSRQYKGSYPRLNGEISYNSAPNTRVVYENFVFVPLSDINSYVPMAPPSGWELATVARTNPSRPVTNIPIQAQNLKQLPAMVRQLGNLLNSPKKLLDPKGAAGAYLGEEFGWKPLIDDLEKLLNFQQYASKRAEKLNQLSSGSGIRSKITLGGSTTSVTIPHRNTVSSNSFTQISQISVKWDQWATIHWRPTTPPSWIPNDEVNGDLARRVVLGLTPEGLAKGLWDVIPWTWLIGWFTNVGDYALAHSWTVPAEHGAVCLMNQMVLDWSADQVTDTNAAKNTLRGSGNLNRTIKQRSVSSTVTPGVNMPYLDMWRLSILGSLFVQRFMR